MRRLLSTLLSAFFALPLLFPLLALTGSSLSDSNLPACCRRNGAHHCSMSPTERRRFAARTRQWTRPPQPCPFRTALVPAQINLSRSFTPAVGQAALFHGALTHPTGIAQTHSRRRIARDRSRQKRGPPAIALS